MNTLRTALFLCTAALASTLATRAHAADPIPDPSGIQILQNLKSFSQYATVLYVAAHPDDENTNLITYLARGRNYRTAYLSVTRGDGGQNIIGPEFDSELGLIRTHELLAARELDHGRQFFTRAIDFGFSKSWDETLRFWDRKQVLGDVVRVIRTFRPDVIVAGFNPDVPGTNGGTHGHHSASGILAREAFPLAGDPTAYPEQLQQGLTPFKPKRLLLGAGGGRGGGGGQGGGPRIDTAGIDPVLNQTYASIAGQSRAMHKSQGFDGGPGAAGRRGGPARGTNQPAGAAPPAPPPAYSSFTVLAGDPATGDIMDGIDTTWSRVKSGGEDIATLTAAAIEKFDSTDSEKNVPALLAIKAKLAALPADAQSDPIVIEKSQLLDRIIADCLGITVTADGPAEAVPGESMHLSLSAAIKSNTPNIRWTATTFPITNAKLSIPAEITAAKPTVQQTEQVLPPNTPVSQPYWLQQESAAGIAHVSDPKLIGRPTNPPVFPVEFSFDINGQTIILRDEVKKLASTSSDSKIASSYPRPLKAIAPVSLAFDSETELFAPGSTKLVNIDITSYRPNLAGSLKLNLPGGWSATPDTQPFTITTTGQRAKLSFNVKSPTTTQATAARITAAATVGNQTFTTGRKEILYPHIPFLLLQPTATLKAVDVDMITKGKTVGYVPGAGDSVAQCIEQMGYTVKSLDAKELTPDNLKSLDALVIGVRAFDLKGNDLAAASPALTDFVNAGGTIISQYNRQASPKIGPLTVRVANIRTTDETAPPTFLAPDNPTLTTPNKITPADFNNWVQERGIYYPQQFDPAFTPLLAFSDPEEQPTNGSLLVAKQGDGYIVYTSLVFFRELPAGVPGAYRLFANLLSLGKTDRN